MEDVPNKVQPTAEGLSSADYKILLIFHNARSYVRRVYIRSNHLPPLEDSGNLPPNDNILPGVKHSSGFSYFPMSLRRRNGDVEKELILLSEVRELRRLSFPYDDSISSPLRPTSNAATEVFDEESRDSSSVFEDCVRRLAEDGLYFVFSNFARSSWKFSGFRRKVIFITQI